MGTSDPKMANFTYIRVICDDTSHMACGEKSIFKENILKPNI